MERDSEILRVGRSGDQIPVGAKFFALLQTGPGANPAPYTVGTISSVWVNRPGCGVDHLPLSNAQVKERVELYLLFFCSAPEANAPLRTSAL
jgi:hypothetical protein